MSSDEVAKQTEAAVLRALGASHGDVGLSAFAEREAIKLREMGLVTIGELRNNLRLKRDLLCAFAPRWTKKSIPIVRPGISLMYLRHILAASTGNRVFVEEYLKKGFIPTKEADLAGRLMETYREALSSVDRPR